MMRAPATGPRGARTAEPDHHPVLEVTGLARSFGDREVLRGVDLSIAPGEAVGLLGPNGAGKTTLLSIVTGLRRPGAGRVRLFGGDPTDPTRRAALGVMPQTTALPGSLEVREVVDLVASHFPDPIPTGDILERFALDSKSRAQCGGLSGGQQRRLLVALALVGRPRLAVLDEPTTGLDLDGRDALWEELLRYRDSGGALLVTSHHLDDIRRLAHRVVVLLDGRVVTRGTIDEVRAVAEVSRIRCRSSADVAAFEQLAGVIAARRDGDEVQIDSRDPDATVVDLVRRDLPFADLDVRGASLEDALRVITAGTP